MPPFTSRETTLWVIPEKYEPELTPKSSTPTTKPPRIPTTLKIPVNRGTEMRPARSLGMTTYCRGFTAMVSMASSCSVIRMMPISAVMALPALPETMRAARTGPSSLMRLRATTDAQRAFGAVSPQGVVALQSQHHAGEGRGQENNQQGLVADKINFLEKAPKTIRRQEGLAQGLEEKKHGPAGFLGQGERKMTETANKCSHNHENIIWPGLMIAAPIPGAEDISHNINSLPSSANQRRLHQNLRQMLN